MRLTEDQWYTSMQANKVLLEKYKGLIDAEVNPELSNGEEIVTHLLHQKDWEVIAKRIYPDPKDCGYALPWLNSLRIKIVVSDNLTPEEAACEMSMMVSFIESGM